MTSANGTGGTGSGGGNFVSNALGGIGDLLGMGGGDYHYGGTWRERFGESLFTNEQKRIHAQRAEEFFMKEIRSDRMHSAAFQKNINKARAAAGTTASFEGTQDVAASHAPKSNLHFQAGVPVKV